MKYMLDTNICTFLIKNKPESVIQKFIQNKPEDICISSITYAGLMHGVENSKEKEKNRIALAMFLSEIQIVSFDILAAQSYGVLKADLQKRGLPIGPMDTLIAAHATALGLVLVTNNVREFSRVVSLLLKNRNSFENRRAILPFYQNIENEGVVLYGNIIS